MFSDDRVLLKWNLVSKDATKLCDFLDNVYPVDMHCFMRHQNGLKKQNLEQILITSADGLYFYRYFLKKYTYISVD